ncbi:MAG: tetratricopeptide repeat protein [Porphyromonas sp.]
MKQYLFRTLVVAGASSLLLASCASKFKISSTGVNVDPNPLTVQGDAVKTRINFAFPKKSFPKKGTLRITPVLRYAGGEKWGKAYDYQGDDVYGNEQVVFYKSGANAVLDFAVPYTPQMQKSELYLTFNGKVGSKTQKISSMKVADGVNATETLATVEGILPAIAPHGFQRVVKEMYDTDILFQIQQANVRGSEINKEDVEEWRYTVQNAKETPNQNVSVEVQSYASPDGGKKLNEKLSENRERNTTAALKKEFKKQDMAGVAIDAHYTAQDWEGFRTLVEKSDLPDKDLVLRVLSMYPDPESREREIKNISVVFKQLADNILPKLRRSRLIANVEIIGKSDAEIQEFIAKAPGHLSAEELLYAAELTNSTTEKMRIYQIANQIFKKDYRAYNNIGALYFAQGKIKDAEAWFNKAATLQDNEVTKLNRGLIALYHGDKEKAQDMISAAINTPELGQALAYLYLKQGEYMKAETAFGETVSNNAAVAQLLNGNYAKALKTLQKITTPSATTELIRAIIAARTNDNNGVITALKSAIALDGSVAYQIADNLEFAKYKNLAAFKALVK